MLKLTDSQKLKACRAILGLTQSEVSRAASLAETAIIQVESGLNSTKAPILKAFYARNGLFLSETGVTTRAPEQSTPSHTLTEEDIRRGFSGDAAFAEHYARWNGFVRNSFRQVVSAFAEQGYDMWFVNMDGQIRIGYKDPAQQRGKPFAFICADQSNGDGFYLLWHDNLDAAFLAFSDTNAHITPEKAARLAEHLSAHRDLVPVAIAELSQGRLPSAYK